MAGDSDLSLEGDSTEFYSDEYEEYIKDLAKSVGEGKVRLTEREKILITGISRQNSKQQMKNKLSTMLANRFALKKAGISSAVTPPKFNEREGIPNIEESFSLSPRRVK